MTLKSVGFLALAALLTIAAISNKEFNFGKMGGGSSEKPMPTWAARAVMLVIAAMFTWYAFSGTH